MSDERRAQTHAMLRVKNEARFIERCLASLWPVAQEIVLFDDHSTDRTLRCAVATLGGGRGVAHRTEGAEHVYETATRRLTVIPSPFVGLNEVRDKNRLWDVTGRRQPVYVIALDGDEALSSVAQRDWALALDCLDRGEPGIQLPFLYLWDDEATYRVDGIYRALWHGRVFCTKNLPNIFVQGFASHHPGGFHCGSIPGGVVARQRLPLPVLHYGYLDAELRQRKYAFYNAIDPNNDGEGRYLHVIGEPNHLAHGPVQVQRVEDYLRGVLP